MFLTSGQKRVELSSDCQSEEIREQEGTGPLWDKAHAKSLDIV